MPAAFNVDFNATTLRFTITDASTGIPLSDAIGNIAINGPLGPVYSNSVITYETDTCQSGSTSSTIRLATSANSNDNYYNNIWIEIVSGTGLGQALQVLSYTGSTRTASMDGTWGTTPDNTSVYRLTFGDINLAAETTNQRSIAIPAQNGQVLQGVYTFNYTVTDTNGGASYYASKTVNYTLDLPTVSITRNINCVAPSLTATDTTDYSVDGIVPSITRTLTLAAAPNVDSTVITSAGPTATRSPFYAPTQYTASVSTIAVYTLPSGATVTATLTGQIAIDTYCENYICDIFCCNTALLERWRSALQLNPSEAPAAYDAWATAQMITGYLQSAYTCGVGQEEIAAIVALYRSITHCTESCNCTDSNVPTLVQGLGLPSGISSIVSGDSYISAVTNNGQTTISFTQAAINALLASDILVANTNVSIVATGSAPSITYTIKGATVTAANNSGVRSTFTGGTTNPDYDLALRNLLKDQIAVVPTTTKGSFEELMAYNMPSNTLSNDGDSLDIDGWFICDVNSDTKKCEVSINNVAIFSEVVMNQPQISQVNFKVKIVRVSATTVGYTWEMCGGNPFSPAILNVKTVEAVSLFPVNNLSSAANKISLEGFSDTAGDVSAVFLQIKLNKV